MADRATSIRDDARPATRTTTTTTTTAPLHFLGFVSSLSLLLSHLSYDDTLSILLLFLLVVFFGLLATPHRSSGDDRAPGLGRTGRHDGAIDEWGGGSGTIPWLFSVLLVGLLAFLARLVLVGIGESVGLILSNAVVVVALGVCCHLVFALWTQAHQQQQAADVRDHAAPEVTAAKSKAATRKDDVPRAGKGGDGGDKAALETASPSQRVKKVPTRVQAQPGEKQHSDLVAPRPTASPTASKTPKPPREGKLKASAKPAHPSMAGRGDFVPSWSAIFASSPKSRQVNSWLKNLPGAGGQFDEVLDVRMASSDGADKKKAKIEKKKKVEASENQGGVAGRDGREAGPSGETSKEKDLHAKGLPQRKEADVEGQGKAAPDKARAKGGQPSPLAHEPAKMSDQAVATSSKAKGDKSKEARQSDDPAKGAAEPSQDVKDQGAPKASDAKVPTIDKGKAKARNDVEAGPSTSTAKLDVKAQKTDKVEASSKATATAFAVGAAQTKSKQEERGAGSVLRLVDDAVRQLASQFPEMDADEVRRELGRLLGQATSAKAVTVDGQAGKNDKAAGQSPPSQAVGNKERSKGKEKAQADSEEQPEKPTNDGAAKKDQPGKGKVEADAAAAPGPGPGTSAKKASEAAARAKGKDKTKAKAQDDDVTDKLLQGYIEWRCKNGLGIGEVVGANGVKLDPVVLAQMVQGEGEGEKGGAKSISANPGKGTGIKDERDAPPGQDTAGASSTAKEATATPQHKGGQYTPSPSPSQAKGKGRSRTKAGATDDDRLIEMALRLNQA